MDSTPDIYNQVLSYRRSGAVPRAIMTKCDLDSDDAISEAEFMDCYRDRSTATNMSHVFLELDLNNDKFITIKEIDEDADWVINNSTSFMKFSDILLKMQKKILKI